MARHASPAGQHTSDRRREETVFTSLLAAAVLGLITADITAFRSRRRLFHGGEAFPCRIRTHGYTSTIWPRLTTRWSRPMHAAWIGDVLMVWRGPVFARAVPLRAAISESGVYALPSSEVRWCGSHPIAVSILVWDGSQIEVAAAEKARLALAGPYLAAVVNHRPHAPIPRRQN
jgi:hypothetical protein